MPKSSNQIYRFWQDLVGTSVFFACTQKIHAILSATNLSQTASCIWFCFNFEEISNAVDGGREEIEKYFYTIEDMLNNYKWIIEVSN